MKKTLLILFLFSNSIFAQEWRKMGDLNGLFTNPIVFNNSLFLSGQISQTNKGVFKFNGINASNIFCKIGQGNFSRNIIQFRNKIVVYGSVKVCKQDTSQNLVGEQLAAWDGEFWEEIPTGSDYITVYSMQEYKNELYVAGNFKDINGITNVNRIARWDGTSWKKLGTGLNGGLATVFTMCVYNNELYVGGIFTNAGGVNVQNIAKWNGANWSAVGNGCSGIVKSMVVNPLKNDLVVAGEFDFVDNTLRTPSFARWNGNQWMKMSNDRVFGVMDLAYYRNQLFVGSNDRSVLNSQDTLEYFYKYNESDSTWHSVLDGTDVAVANLYSYGDSLLLVGGFTKPYSGIVAYYENPVGIENIKKKKDNYLLPTIPNPIIKNATFEYSIMNGEAYIEINDVLGNKLDKIQLVNRKGKIEYEFADQFSSGIYYLSLIVNGIRYDVQRIVLL